MKERRFVNRGRLVLFGCVAVVGCAVFLALAAASLGSGDTTGAVIMAVFGGVSLGIAVRSTRIGVWFGSDTVRVSRWLSSHRRPRSSVLLFQVVDHKGGRCPAMVLKDGEVVPIYGLERGVFHEATIDRSEGTLAQMNALLRKS